MRGRRRKRWLSTTLFSSRTHLITRINCGEERVGEGKKGGERAGARRGELALRCPVITSQPDGPGSGGAEGGRDESVSNSSIVSSVFGGFARFFHAGARGGGAAFGVAIGGRGTHCADCGDGG